MVGQRRFLPLVALLASGLVVITARLIQVQIVEAPVWGREAANLVRSSNVIPYHRGEIVDRNGTVIARDEDLYEIEFVYRDFRRGHPLALVAHARAALELSAVPLGAALDHLEDWAAALVAITPTELAAFARGEAVAIGGVTVPASLAPEVEQRARRASDVRWYVGELLHVTKTEWRALRLDDGDPDHERPYVELLASRARHTTKERLLFDLRNELRSAREHLTELADLLSPTLRRDDSAGTDDHAAMSPLARLVAALERQRRATEDASADALFERAAGFGAGRVSTASLEGACDTRWIAGLMRWDEPRRLEWSRTRRARWLARLERQVLPRILARAAIEEEQGRKHACARLMDGLAELYAAPADHARKRGDAPPSWTELGDLAVFGELDTLFEGRRVPRELRESHGLGALIALDDPELQAAAGALDDPWMALGLASELAHVDEVDPAAPRSAAESAARWNEIAGKGLPAEDPEAMRELVWLARGLEGRFVAASDRALLALSIGDDGVAAPRPFSRARIDAAMQEERSIQKDQQSRAVLLSSEPEYVLVHALEREPQAFAGFHVREATRRIYPALDPNGRPLAAGLIGGVRKPSLRELFAQVRDERRYDQLEYQVLRSQREEEELADLAGRLFRADEWTGGAGLEDYFDPELRGSFGWREVQGLAGRGAPSIGQAPVDGKDLELTLDLELQRAAQEVLEHPDMPRDEKADELWFQNPVGAIVLMSAEGEVLVAASVPTQKGTAIPGRDREREIVRERTLTRPTFNPPGSVFKPFVAAFALDRGLTTAAQTHYCGVLPDGGWGYQDMHCTGLHHDCDLQRALKVSCNAYFAQLGECYTTQELLEMSHVFGFDEPTGVRMFSGRPAAKNADGTAVVGRSGLVEHWRYHLDARSLAELETASAKRKFACGLRYPEATPMQVARATAALATGWLPDVSLVRKIGSVPIARRGHELPIRTENLEFVRHAMELVVSDPEGSAHGKGLDEHALGFRLAAKTGSADYAAIRTGAGASHTDLLDAEEGRLRKHTWVAGYFPAENPRAVVVVYLHDTSRTSSHTAVYVAAQFLRQPAVRAWLTKADEADRPVTKTGANK